MVWPGSNTFEGLAVMVTTGLKFTFNNAEEETKDPQEASVTETRYMFPSSVDVATKE